MAGGGPPRMPTSAGLLGYAGLIPFLGLALALAAGLEPLGDLTLHAFLVYAALILSFLGGIRWGAAAVGGYGSAGAWFLSVMPCLWAFACLLVPDPSLGAWGLMLGFALLGVADTSRPADGLPGWMRSLRLRLTLIVVAAHALLISVL